MNRKKQTKTWKLNSGTYKIDDAFGYETVKNPVKFKSGVGSLNPVHFGIVSLAVIVWPMELLLSPLHHL